MSTKDFASYKAEATQGTTTKFEMHSRRASAILRDMDEDTHPTLIGLLKERLTAGTMVNLMFILLSNLGKKYIFLTCPLYYILTEIYFVKKCVIIFQKTYLYM